MIEGVIYKFTNILNDKVYIGRTINEQIRLSQHKRAKTKSHFHNSINKYGFDKFNYEVIFRCNSKDRYIVNVILNSLEKYYIRIYKSNVPDKGYNETLGGEGTIGYHHSKQTKDKISRSLKLTKLLK